MIGSAPNGRSYLADWMAQYQFRKDHIAKIEGRWVGFIGGIHQEAPCISNPSFEILAECLRDQHEFRKEYAHGKA